MSNKSALQLMTILGIILMDLFVGCAASFADKIGLEIEWMLYLVNE